MSERNAAAVTALARAAALSLYACQEGQINLHKLLDAAVDSTIRSAAYAARASSRWATLPATRSTTSRTLRRNGSSWGCRAAYSYPSGWQLHLQTAR
ncbi:MAG: hypothetical protein U0X20_12405 [Caldilineaceae bacterium]